jgi:hypothetical protein
MMLCGSLSPASLPRNATNSERRRDTDFDIHPFFITKVQAVVRKVMNQRDILT